MTKHSKGRIEVICGSMFSGKTEELIRRLRRAQIARQQIQVFKPVIDNRYHAEKVMSHNGADFEALPVASLTEYLRRCGRVVGRISNLDSTLFTLLANGHPLNLT